MRLADYEHMPAVGAVMTPFPFWVDADARLPEVEKVMRDQDIRHLPVKSEGRLIGLISARDVTRLVHPALPPADRDKIHARQLAVKDPFVVGAEAPLAGVLREMAARKIGTALVCTHDRLAGILSMVDVCELLAEELERRFHPGTPPAA